MLHVVTIHSAGLSELLEPLCRRLEATFGLAVDVQSPSFDSEQAFDPSRGQYNSRVLLAHLLEQPTANGGRVLGVTAADLFIPVLTYVFGEAQLDGRAAVVSTHRLQPERYGLPADPALLLARLTKEAVHELGHTYGLVHCPDGQCVMCASTYCEEIDLKTRDFCPRCQKVVRRRRGAAPPR